MYAFYLILSNEELRQLGLQQGKSVKALGRHEETRTRTKMTADRKREWNNGKNEWKDGRWLTNNFEDKK